MISRQGQRLSSQFATLQAALALGGTVTDSADTADINHLIVFEVVGSVERFLKATERIDGLNLVADLIGAGLDPDEDFYYEDEYGEAKDEQLPQTLYLVMANARAIDQLVELFNSYQEYEGNI